MDDTKSQIQIPDIIINTTPKYGICIKSNACSKICNHNGKHLLDKDCFETMECIENREMVYCIREV